MLVVGRVVEVEFGSTGCLHHDVEDGELECGKGADHDATWAETDGGKLHETNFFSEDAETLRNGSFTTGTSLVDLGEKGVGRVGDDRGSNTGNDTGSD